MDQAEAAKFLKAVEDSLAKGQLPEIKAFTPDQKQTLLCLARAFEGERSREIAARVLPLLRSEEDIEALLMWIDVCRVAGKTAKVSMVVLRFAMTLPGAVLIAFATSLSGAVDTRKAIEWLITLSKLQ